MDGTLVGLAVTIVLGFLVAIVLLDHWLRWRGQVGRPPPVPLRGA